MSQYFRVSHPLRQPFDPFAIRAQSLAQAKLLFGRVAKYKKITKLEYDKSAHIQKSQTVY